MCSQYHVLCPPPVLREGSDDFLEVLLVHPGGVLPVGDPCPRRGVLTRDKSISAQSFSVVLRVAGPPP